MARTHGNRQKHESNNPLQAKLIDRFHERVVHLVEQAAPATLLEVGCGEGYVLEALRSAGVAARMSGVDRSSDAIDAARGRLGDAVNLRVADAVTLKGEAPHDLVMMIEVLEHLDDPHAMLEVLEAITARWVLLSVPWEPWFRLANLGRLKNVSALGNDPEHVNHWTGRAFRDFVGRRFTVQAAVQAFPWTLVLAER